MRARSSMHLRCGPRWRSRRSCQSRSSRGCFCSFEKGKGLALAIIAVEGQLRQKGIAPYLETTGMKAGGYKKSLPIDDVNSLIDFETGKPEPRARDIRVAVKASSRNPGDYKCRNRARQPDGETTTMGFDAACV